MATVLVGCMCVQSTVVEGTSIMQRSYRCFMSEAIFTVSCYHGNRTNWKVVQSMILIYTIIVK